MLKKKNWKAVDLTYVTSLFIGSLSISGRFGKENLSRAERILNKSCKYEVALSSKIFFLPHMTKNKPRRSRYLNGTIYVTRHKSYLFILVW